MSPSKTPSGSEQSAHGSPALPERKTKVKRVRVVDERSGETRSAPKHKRELRSAMKARGKGEHTKKQNEYQDLNLSLGQHHHGLTLWRCCRE